MSVADFMRPGMKARQSVRILTVDPATRRVEGTLKDGAMVQIRVAEIPATFRWPKTDELWTVRQDDGYWILVGRYEDKQDEYGIVETMVEGETKITGNTIVAGTLTTTGDLSVNGRADAQIPVCALGRSATQSIADNSFVTVNWNATVLDNDEMASLADDRIIIKTAGIYQVTSFARFAGNAMGFRFAGVSLNGNEITSDLNSNFGASFDAGLAPSATVKCVIDDYIQMYVYQNSGGPLNLTQTTDYFPILRVARLGRY